jgi:hypothetical protein
LFPRQGEQRDFFDAYERGMRQVSRNISCSLKILGGIDSEPKPFGFRWGPIVRHQAKDIWMPVNISGKVFEIFRLGRLSKHGIQDFRAQDLGRQSGRNRPIEKIRNHINRFSTKPLHSLNRAVDGGRVKEKSVAANSRECP